MSDENTPDEGIVPDESVPAAAANDPEPTASLDPAVADIDQPPAEGGIGEEPGRTYYVQAPVAPKRRGNRGIGTLLAVLAAVVFALLYALAVAIIRSVQGAGFAVDFLLLPPYYVPVLFFLVAFVALVLIVNRGAWWAYILGSLVVGLVVYFGTTGVALLADGVVLMTPSEAADAFGFALSRPYVIAAALIAREVSVWAGFLISHRGRKVTLRNAEARAAFDRELVQQRAGYERAGLGA